MLLAALVLSGCDGGDARPLDPPAEIRGSGVIRGRVIFSGTPPEMRELPNRPCHDGAEPIMEEFVIVNDNGTLRNVFAYLADAPASSVVLVEPPVLDQVDCQYVPHVLGVHVDQPLRVRSSDPTMHNVHCLTRANRPVNFGMTTAGEERTITFQKHEFIPVKCDVHPWMIAYVGVFEHPWFAVTAETGEFEITAVPAGSYTLTTWHERYGRLEQPVTVGEDGTVEVSFEYKAP